MQGGEADYIKLSSINIERRKTPDGSFVPLTQEDIDRVVAENPGMHVRQLRWKLIGLKKEAA